ncbi:S8 family serine peptidase [Blastococcus montanus]|uniref:S8 family serine peptidase n=1 Tax=Blastococcus montanus TaxID=3144973 RepID=UPI00320A30DF
MRDTTRRSAGRGRRGIAVLAAAALGFGGTAVIGTLASAAPAVPIADGFGPAGDGLTRLVVTLDGGVTAEQVALLDAHPAIASAQSLFDGSALVAGKGLVPSVVTELLAGAQVTPSEPGEVFGESVSDPYWSTYGWNLSNTGSNAYGQSGVAEADVSAPEGWRAGTGRGLTVAVLDSGFAAGHPDLQGALWTNPDQPCGAGDTDGNGKPGDCHGWNFYTNSADVTNAGLDNSHGTTVAGAVGARAGNGQGTAGVAPDVSIMPLVIGAGRSVDLNLGAQAIRYAADNGADVINASWGGPGGAAILTEAIDYANSLGVVVVAAAGNDSANRDTSPVYPASINRPNVITVGASTAADTVSDFSAYGAGTVELFAPGTLVFSTTPDGWYKLVSGTSIAAPQVAAAAALYRGLDRAASAPEVVQRLLADVEPLPAFAGRSVTGGRLSLTKFGETAAPVKYRFTNMTAMAGTVTPQVVASGSVPGGAYEARISLGMEHGGDVLALTQHPIALNGQTVTTDDAGEARFSLGNREGLGSLLLAPSTELQDGRYVLLAQLFLDGEALGMAYAAPLLVGEEAQRSAEPAPEPSPGTPVPPSGGSAPAPGGSDPAPGGATPAPGTAPTPAPTSPTAPAPSLPGAPAPGAPAPSVGSPAPGGSTPAPGSSPAPAPSSPVVGGGRTPDGSTAPIAPRPGGETPSSPAPASPAPSAPAPSSPAPSSPAPSAPAPSAPAPSAPQPVTGGEKSFPSVGAYRITSVSPSVVSASGGTRVRISGSGFESGVRVRVGTSTAVRIVGLSGTEIVFESPQLMAGVYDVHVFAPDRTETVLDDALTLVTVASAPSAPAPSAPAPGADPVVDAPGGAAPPAGSSDGTVRGPRGERLLPSARFSALAGSIWTVDCTSGCSGLSI